MILKPEWELKMRNFTHRKSKKFLLSEPGSERQVPSSGANLGNWEFDSQTNDNANCVPVDDRFKFVDDLTCLEVVNLINIGLASHNFKQQVPNDIHTHGQIIPNSHLKSQNYLDQINQWTKKQQMIISEAKTKTMIINFTNKYQFQTRLTLNNKNIETVDSMKILGTVFTNTLSWNENCARIIKKVNARMQLLRKVWSFGSSCEEMVNLWKTYCLSILEQSCAVWTNGLTCENEEDLERMQKTFCKLILGNSYKSYHEALKTLNLETLKTRRQKLTLKFAKQSLADGKLREFFPLRTKRHMMNTRKTEKYIIFKANTERYRNSPIIAMQRLLNEAS